MGRPPIGKTAMTGAERVRLYRLKHGVTKKPVTKPSGPAGASGAKIAELNKHLELAHERIAKHLKHIENAHKRIAERDKYIAQLEARIKARPAKKARAKRAAAQAQGGDK